MRRVLMTGAIALVVIGGSAGTVDATTPKFSNHRLIATTTLPDGYSTAPHANSTGDSEPAIAFGPNGQMAVDGLAWLPYQVNLWTGQFGQVPSYFGAMDTDLNNVGNGRITLGDEDADVEITAQGTTLLADLDAIINRNWSGFQLGVNVTRCPAGSTSPSDCTHIFLDKAGADREWITSAGHNAWVSYHDSESSTLIRVKRSTDDGRTWTAAGSPIPGQGRATGAATYNNSIGPIVADPSTGEVYESYAAGEAQTKGFSGDYNNIYVSHSTDGGRHWTSVRVFHTAPLTQLANFWPSLAVDPITHRVWTAWTDLHGVAVSYSDDGGNSWSAAQTVSTKTTTVEPWVAARGGKADIVYYASNAASTDDTSAVWNVFDSQLNNGAWHIKKVSNTPNHLGRICLNGSGCPHNADRELLDLFEVAEDPISGKAAVIYTDTTIDTWTSPSGVTKKLPEIVLAFEN